MGHKYIIQFILLLSITAGSCKKFIEVNPPKNQLATNNIFNDNGTANSAIFAIYSQMLSGNASPYAIPFTTGISGDELTNNNSAALDIYTNAIDPVNSFYANSIWTTAYNFIYQANAIFEGCSSSTKLDPDVKKQLMAEAMFIRAYWHFYLVNLYGDIPLATTTDYTKNSLAIRTASNLLYDQIITDLKYAQANLNEKYIAADGITTSDERARPNGSTATALLSRVYLYTGKYSDAEAQATTLINTSYYSLVPLDAVFLKNSSEAIWQLMPVNNSLINTIEGANFIPENSSPVLEGKPSISPQLLNSFEGGDLRRTHWIGQFIDTSVKPNLNYYYPYKYKIRFGSSYGEYSMIFRLAEQYLIRAEARNEQNNILGAISDLNTIRARARDFSNPQIPDPLPNYTVLMSKTAIKTAILQERRVELFTEQGHRWFDLKRTGEVNSVMAAVTPLKGGTWNNNMVLWPIPQSELLNDPKLTQNPGY